MNKEFFIEQLAKLQIQFDDLEKKYETMRLATLEWGKDVDKVKRWSDQHLQRIQGLEAAVGIRSAPESLLVERVSDALMESVKDQGSMARAAILAIAAEVERRGDKGLDLDPGETADWLRSEANPTGQEDFDG